MARRMTAIILNSANFRHQELKRGKKADIIYGVYISTNIMELWRATNGVRKIKENI